MVVSLTWSALGTPRADSTRRVVQYATHAYAVAVGTGLAHPGDRAWDHLPAWAVKAELACRVVIHEIVMC
jgi:hypothetical protein